MSKSKEKLKGMTDEQVVELFYKELGDTRNVDMEKLIKREK